VDVSFFLWPQGVHTAQRVLNNLIQPRRLSGWSSSAFISKGNEGSERDGAFIVSCRAEEIDLIKGAPVPFGRIKERVVVLLLLTEIHSGVRQWVMPSGPHSAAARILRRKSFLPRCVCLFYNWEYGVPNKLHVSSYAADWCSLCQLCWQESKGYVGPWNPAYYSMHRKILAFITKILFAFSSAKNQAYILNLNPWDKRSCFLFSSFYSSLPDVIRAFFPINSRLNPHYAHHQPFNISVITDIGRLWLSLWVQKPQQDRKAADGSARSQPKFTRSSYNFGLISFFTIRDHRFEKRQYGKRGRFCITSTSWGSSSRVTLHWFCLPLIPLSQPVWNNVDHLGMTLIEEICSPGVELFNVGCQTLTTKDEFVLFPFYRAVSI